MKDLILNDLHIGVRRTGGTTFASAEALRQFARDKYKKLLQIAVDQRCERVIINGDLTDSYNIELSEALELYVATAEFMSANPGISMVWSLGNHDLSKDSSQLGTVAFIGSLLEKFSDRFKLVSEPTMLDGDVYVIPHLVNQKEFDMALEDVPESAKWVLLHCNYDNTFAGAADHSLNLSREQAKLLASSGARTVLGHEHQGRELMKGKVLITGNQFPTSVADCLPHGDAQKDGTKRALIIDGSDYEWIQTWTPGDSDGWFEKIDWTELKDVVEEGRGFIRVEGNVPAGDSTDAIRAIADFRQRSQSFVVTNATSVEQVDSPDELGVSIDDLKSVNVIELLLAELNPAQQAKVREVLADDS